MIASAGERAGYRFLEFFTAQIRNPNTRRAFARAVGDFLAWLEHAGIAWIGDVASIHVAAYVEELGRHQSAPSTKLSLAAIRMMFDWLATGGILPFNPATAVRQAFGQDRPDAGARPERGPAADRQHRCLDADRAARPGALAGFRR